MSWIAISGKELITDGEIMTNTAVCGICGQDVTNNSGEKKINGNISRFVSQHGLPVLTIYRNKILGAIPSPTFNVPACNYHI